MSKDDEAYRDEMVRRVKKVIVELEELHEWVEERAEEAPDFWTQFDVNRMIDLKTATRLLIDIEDKLMQVGRWGEIKKLGWATVKARLKKK